MTITAIPPSTWEFTPGEVAEVRAGIAELREVQRQIARLEARAIEVRARLLAIARDQQERSGASEAYELPVRSMAAEVACALRESPRSARARLEQASDLVERLPRVVAALREGGLQMAHARHIHAEAGRFAEGAEDRLGLFERRAVEEALVRTPAQTGRIVRVLAAKLAPVSLQARHEQARAGRGVWVHDLPDGMSELCAVLASPVAHGIRDRLTQLGLAVTRERRRARQGSDGTRLDAADPDVRLSDAGVPAEDGAAPGDDRGVPAEDRFAAAGERAESPPAPGDARGMDELRADLLGDLLLTAAPTAHQLHAPGDDASRAFAARVQVTIPVDALIDPLEAGHVATLDGTTPIDTLGAWALAGEAPTWERLLVRPDTGAVLAVDTYRPTIAQRRWLAGRDGTCRFPGCGVPAREADVDHTIDWARGGRTRLDNLAALCEPHHVLKHHSPWRVRQRGGGVLEWTSPAGHTYTDRPATGVAFRYEFPDPGPRPGAPPGRDAAAERGSPPRGAMAHASPWDSPPPADDPPF